MYKSAKNQIDCLIVTGIIIVSFTVPSQSIETNNFLITTEIDTNVLEINNETDFLNTLDDGTNDDYQDEIKGRFLASILFNIGDSIKAKVAICKNNDYWDSLQGVEKIDNLTSDLKIYNAYFQYLGLSIGRQFYGNPGDLALYFGPVDDYNLSINSLDMVRWELERFKYIYAELFVSKLNESATFSSTLRKRDWDTDLVGTRVGLNNFLPQTQLISYFYLYLDHAPQLKSEDQLTLFGLQLKGATVLENLKYHIEFCINDGIKPEKEISNQKVRVKYAGRGVIIGTELTSNPLMLLGKFKNIVGIKIDYASGSGDDTNSIDKDESFWSLNPDLHYGDIWWKTISGIGPEQIGSTGLQNFQILGLTFSNEFVNSSERSLILQLKYNKFQQPIVSNLDNTATTDRYEDKNDLGTEVGFNMIGKLNNALSINMSMCSFYPGFRYVNHDVVTKTSVFIKLKFDIGFGKTSFWAPPVDDLALLKNNI